MQTATARSASDPRRFRHNLEPVCLLGQLPPEVVLRMFGFLSAEDLAVSAQACRYLASVSSQDELWRRLYCARYAFLCFVSLAQNCGITNVSKGILS